MKKRLVKKNTEFFGHPYKVNLRCIKTESVCIQQKNEACTETRKSVHNSSGCKRNSKHYLRLEIHQTCHCPRVFDSKSESWKRFKVSNNSRTPSYYQIIKKLTMLLQTNHMPLSRSCNIVAGKNYSQMSFKGLLGNKQKC